MLMQFGFEFSIFDHSFIFRFDKDKEDIEQIHSMSDRERKIEFEKNPKFIPNKQIKEKQYKFLQKYYHRGAFFLVLFLLLNRVFLIIHFRK